MAGVVLKQSETTDRLLKTTKTRIAGEKFSTNKSSPAKAKRKRKILKPLQRSAQDENTLVGNDRFEIKQKSGKRKLQENALDSPRKIQRTIFSFMSPVKIYQDPEDTSDENDAKTQLDRETDETNSKITPDTEIDPEAIKLMVQQEIPVEYWREIAQQRREALVEALDENEKLHHENENLRDTVETLKVENEGLKEENEGLKGMAEKAEYFANMVNLLMTDENVDEDETDNADEIKIVS